MAFATSSPVSSPSDCSAEGLARRRSRSSPRTSDQPIHRPEALLSRVWCRFMPAEGSMSKPESIAQYMAWLKNEFGMDSRDLLRSRYDAASSKAFLDVEASPVWQTVLTQAREFNDAYRIETGYKLLVTDDPPKLVRKEF